MAQSKNTKTELERDWYLIDIEGKTLGRISTEIAGILRGKKKVNFAPNADNGDYVVAINSDKFVLTGNKETQKRYYRHSGYLGNLKTATVADLKKKKPGDILKFAVEGMLPHNKLQKQFIGRLKIYSGTEHPHQNAKFKNKEA